MAPQGRLLHRHPLQRAHRRGHAPDHPRLRRHADGGAGVDAGPVPGVPHAHAVSGGGDGAADGRGAGPPDAPPRRVSHRLPCQRLHPAGHPALYCRRPRGQLDHHRPGEAPAGAVGSGHRRCRRRNGDGKPGDGPCLRPCQPGGAHGGQRELLDRRGRQRLYAEGGVSLCRPGHGGPPAVGTEGGCLPAHAGGRRSAGPGGGAGGQRQRGRHHSAADPGGPHL